MENLKSENFVHYFDIRQSLIILISKILAIEIVMSLVHFFAGKGLMALKIHDAMFGSFRAETWEIIIFHIINTGWLVIIIMSWASTHYIISSKEISSSTGLITRQRKSYDINGIQEIKTSQGLLGRIFGYGTIRLENPLIRSNIILKNLPKPEFYAELIRAERDRAIKKDSTEKIIPSRNKK